ncbi:CHAD domain-containing protein [candidate division KSB1 bacterium]|nr:CHAD domain-containing protein [candidate division KSB1 bacterium]
MQPIETYNIQARTDLQAVREKIMDNFSTMLEGSEKNSECYYDTFDWRLYQNNVVLKQEVDRIKLCNIDSEQAIAARKINIDKSSIFWWDLPDGALRDRLSEILDVRALIKRIDLVRNVTRIRILNEDEKTVLRVALHELMFDRDTPLREEMYALTISPVRGYAEEHADFVSFIESCGVAGKAKNLFLSMADRLQYEVGAYSSKIDIRLDPSMQSDVAVKMIIKSLLSVMRQNEEGIRNDIDTEFLHDYRVSIRRTRSVLSQIKGLFLPELSSRFRAEFKILGNMTNRLRDLDVYLLNENQYKEILPESLQNGLDNFFKRLKAERKKEHDSLVKYLDSPAYDELMGSWQRFLESAQPADDSELIQAAVPVIDLAGEVIRHRYAKLVKIGQKIDYNTPNDKLHKLRIQCKKLRYLLEFFSSLFPQENYNVLVKRLKTIQGTLGDFNDYSVQQRKLLAALKEEDQQDDRFYLLAAAMGGLITHLHHQQLRCRETFSSIFSEFINQETNQLFEDIFDQS